MGIRNLVLVSISVKVVAALQVQGLVAHGLDPIGWFGCSPQENILPGLGPLARRPLNQGL